MGPILRQAIVYLALTSGIPPAAAITPADAPVRRLAAEDVTSRDARPDEAWLGLAAALAYDAERVYAVDAEDCAVKVFTKSGRFEAVIGRSGHGSGEFSFPSGVAVLGGRLFVADKLNRRIQVLDLSGRFLRSFALPFAPDRVLVLAADRLVVTRRPSGRPAGERILHFLSASGEPLREELVARTGGDPVLDAFLNMVLVSPGPRGDLFVIFKCQERAVLHYGPDGGLAGRVPVDRRYGSKAVSLQVRGGRRTVEAFCWESAQDRGRIFLLAPEYTDGGDIGPGDRVYVIDTAGRLEARIELPARVSRLAVEGDRIFAVDLAGELRVFRVAR